MNTLRQNHKMTTATPSSGGPLELRKSCREALYSPCHYMWGLAIALLVSLFIQVEAGRIAIPSGLTVTGSLISKPRLLGPARFYFQHNEDALRERFRPFESRRVDTETVEESGALAHQEDSVQQAVDEEVGHLSREEDWLTYNETEVEEEVAATPCQSNDNGSGGSCASVLSTPRLTELELRAAQLELFKRRILNQMNLRQIPVINESAWASVPSVLRKRLKIKVDTNNRILEDPMEENEEKEAIILLQKYPFELNKLPSLTFTFKLADAIDPRNIRSAWIHAEALDEFPDDFELFYWEIVPPWPETSSVEQTDDNQEEEFSLNTPHVNADLQSLWDVYWPNIEQSAVNGAEFQPSLQSFKIIQPMIAKAVVKDLNGNDKRVLSVEITARLIHWIMQGSKHRYGNRIQPIIRHILLVCPRCSDSSTPINPKKVVVEIQYRTGLRRLRRSVGTSESGLTNQCREDGHQFTCCTQPLSISFAEIGWDRWVMFPKKVEPNYCRGSCQAVGSKSMHYEVIDLLKQKNATRFAGMHREATHSCCHPNRRNSFSIVYMDEKEEVRMHVLHNLIVMGCGCS